MTTVERSFSEFEWMHNKTLNSLSTDWAGKCKYLLCKYDLNKGTYSRNVCIDDDSIKLSDNEDKF